MCEVDEYNCSHDCLTSSSLVSELLDLQKTNPDLYVELSSDEPATHSNLNEVEPTFPDYEDADDSAVPVEILLDHIVSSSEKPTNTNGVAVDEDSYLAPSGIGESMEAGDEDFLDGDSHGAERSGPSSKMASVGERVIKVPKFWAGEKVWDSYRLRVTEDM
jgi:hypothetical protein